MRKIYIKNGAFAYGERAEPAYAVQKQNQPACSRWVRRIANPFYRHIGLHKTTTTVFTYRSDKTRSLILICGYDKVFNSYTAESVLQNNYNKSINLRQ